MAKKLTNMFAMIRNARSKGYEPKLNGRALAIEPCPSCKAHKAVVMVSAEKSVLACAACGLRKPITSHKTQVINKDDRCKAMTKKGTRCRNKAMAGHDYCGPHCKDHE